MIGLAGSVATFATWQLQSFLSFSDFDNRQRAWVKDVSLLPLLPAELSS
jgi:hypothetical protein